MLTDLIRRVLPAQKATAIDAPSYHSCAELIDALIEENDVTVSYDDSALQKIPEQGRLIVLANDPSAGLSSISLLQLVTRMRQDVKVLADEQSEWLTAMSDVVIQGETLQHKYNAAAHHLAQEGVLILQPVHFGQARGVPRLRQERWPTDFVNLAEHTLSPLLHVHVSSDEQPLLQQARAFYRGNDILQGLAKRFLPQVRDQRLVVGELIDPADYKELNLKPKFKAKLLRKQLYRVADGKGSYFNTLPALIPPQPRSLLMESLEEAELLGETRDQKLIYLCRLKSDSPLLQEIGRLRELAFRVVGEGSGSACDVDDYDPAYEHIVLWDAQDKEVVGAYRLRETFSASVQSLYTSSLVEYSDSARSTLTRGAELGRSFVQPKYWGSRSLDYLWAGIAAYIRKRPRVRYLLGAVSISNAYSQQAKDLLIGYYSLFYTDPDPIISCKRPYIQGFAAKERNFQLFEGLDAKDAFVVLREQLGLLGHAVPTLYKQYTELCEPGGALFHGFNIDPDFQDCIDGLVVVDLSLLKPLKRKRYELEQHDFMAFEREPSSK